MFLLPPTKAVCLAKTDWMSISHNNHILYAQNMWHPLLDSILKYPYALNLSPREWFSNEILKIWKANSVQLKVTKMDLTAMDICIRTFWELARYQSEIWIGISFLAMAYT